LYVSENDRPVVEEAEERARGQGMSFSALVSALVGNWVTDQQRADALGKPLKKKGGD
jgi:hypothetical protein